MLRWILRLSVGAALAVLALLLWQRANSDLDDDEEFTEETPLEFEVPIDPALGPSPYEQAQANLAPTTTDDGAPASSPNGTAPPTPADHSAWSDALATMRAAEREAPTPAAPMLTLQSPDALPDDEADTATLTLEPLAAAPDADETAVLAAADVTKEPPAPPSGELHPDVMHMDDDAPPAADDAKGEAEGDEASAPGEDTPPGAGDNLVLIHGIGSAYGAKLAEMGITTYGALINTSVDHLADAFPRVGRAELENWQLQAMQLQDEAQ